jgi:hypothetical protein
MHILTQLLTEMIAYEQGCPHRAGHLLKVHAYAKVIGEGECLDEGTQLTLEAASIVHDIGIRSSLDKYSSSAGRYQEKEGPPIAEEMLSRLGFDASVTDRVCFLVGHHHTIVGVNGLDWQILLEADFLVNMEEEAMSETAIRFTYDRVFQTETGRRFCRQLYGTM